MVRRFHKTINMIQFNITLNMRSFNVSEKVKRKLITQLVEDQKIQPFWLYWAGN